MKKFLEEFKAFALKGNVMDMAIGVIIGGAFGKIVTSLVNDIFMPVLSLLTGGMSVADKFVQLGNSDVQYITVDAAKEAGVATLNYGLFIQAIIDFILMALCIFLFIKLVSNLRRKQEEAPAPEARKCNFCLEPVADEATRCPHCTSELPAPAAK